MSPVSETLTTRNGDWEVDYIYMGDPDTFAEDAGIVYEPEHRSYAPITQKVYQKLHYMMDDYGINSLAYQPEFGFFAIIKKTVPNSPKR